MKPQIVNIINFIRAVEPRAPMDLLTPVREQLRLLEAHRLPGTFLLQYDALIDPRFVELLRGTTADIEIGAWLEIVQPLAEDAGLTWRGRPGFAWDWHANVGFSVGYTPKERERLIDVLMARFQGVFGRYPKSVGSWIIDAHSLAYMADRYGIVASCNCKDQWGTDGYTLWGGYYGQAYYPSRRNAYAPAQSPRNQIPVPVFKMLGSDPIYQYDTGLRMDDGAARWQGVVTLEPVYAGPSGGGGDPAWVDWYLRENFNGTCIHFGYAQAGQENSFGWDAMGAGLTYQMERIAELSRAGALSVWTLERSGAWFREAFPDTPPTAIAALTDWKNEGRRSVWFNGKRHRVNVYAEGDRFWIRDWHLFDDGYEERYLDAVCTGPVLQYDNPPAMDGNRWSGNGLRAGIYPAWEDGGDVRMASLRAWDDGDGVAVEAMTDGGAFRIRCDDAGVEMTCGRPFALRFRSGRGLPVVGVEGDVVHMRHRGHRYGLRVACGAWDTTDGLGLRSDAGGRLRVGPA